MKPTNYDAIPKELKDLDQWVYFKLEDRGEGKKTKIPKNAKTGGGASTTRSSSWSSFKQAIAACNHFKGDGIGFVFAENGGYVGLDIDHDKDTEIVDWFGSYAEESFSGDGIHVIMKGSLPDWVQTGGLRAGKYELYAKARYFVFTGRKINENAIVDCQDKLNEFCLEVFPAPKQFVGEKEVDISGLLNSASSHSSIIDRIQNSNQAAKFNALMRGDTSEYGGDQSRADAALLSILRFWTSGNKAEAYSIFKQSALMRKKAERPDYLDRTWDKLSGEILTPVEPVPADFIHKVKSEIPPWRMITVEHVKEAIAGTILEPMVEALCSPTDPPLPIQIGLAKALPLCGCALSERSTKKLDLSICGHGTALSRVKIMTAGGQTPNFWTLLVGESASGKDIGNLAEKAAKDFKWYIGGSGSEEGIADAYSVKNNGLMVISEMMNWLNEHHWQAKAAGFLTEAFSQGSFSYAMSKRGQNAVDRESEYCFPNIIASVQPGIIQAYAKPQHIDSGFLGRFLILQVPRFIAYPRCSGLHNEVAMLIDCLKILREKTGEFTPQARYNERLSEMFFEGNASPNATWRRIANQYYPRLALILSCDKGYPTTSVEITDEGWKRAEVLCQYLFTQAEEVIGNLFHDQKKAEAEGLYSKILDFVKAKKEVHKYEISQRFSRGTNNKERMAAIEELVSRGLLEIVEKDTGKNNKKSSVIRAV